MVRKLEIWQALANLPENLITPEIAAAGIEEGNIKILDVLPHRFMSGETILSILEKNKDSYYWKSFKLANIPVEYRLQKVCDFSVSQDIDNFPDVPEDYRNQFILEKLLSRLASGIKYLHLIPQTLWNATLAYSGINSAYHLGKKSQFPLRHYCTSENEGIKMVQIFLTFVPGNIKDKQFYFGLLSDTNLSPGDANKLTPEKYKDQSYYLKMAVKQFSLIPRSQYCYKIFMEAMSENSKTPVNELLSKEIQPHLFKYMDEVMADRLITLSASDFNKLPQQFQTSQRLILAIDSFSRNYNFDLADKSFKHLFTKEVCEAFVRKNNQCPPFPKDIWTSEFLNYCLKYGQSYQWFEQLPKRLQTHELVAKAIIADESNIVHARPELISLETAQKIHCLQNHYRKNIPRRFYNDFFEQTGLPEDFLGGEVTFHELRNLRKNNTYCKLGHCCLGFYQPALYRAAPCLIMTRRTPYSIRPEVVFNRTIGTFHSTWLEKLVADYDPAFIKPVIAKKIKEYQTNGYYSVEKKETYKEHVIYQNSFLDGKICYTVKIKGKIESCRTIENMKEMIDETTQGTKDNPLT